jgi:hypothetical protein
MLIGKPEERDHTGYLIIDRRIILKWISSYRNYISIPIRD